MKIIFFRNIIKFECIDKYLVNISSFYNSYDWNYIKLTSKNFINHNYSTTVYKYILFYEVVIRLKVLYEMATEIMKIKRSTITKTKKIVSDKINKLVF